MPPASSSTTTTASSTMSKITSDGNNMRPEAVARPVVVTSSTTKRYMIGDVMQQQQRRKNGMLFNSFFLCQGQGCCPPPNLLYCSAINSASSSSDAFASDSESESSYEAVSTSSSSSSSLAAASTPAAAATTTSSSWKDKLLKASNYASLLCVLDCTILPILTFALPLLGILAASPAQLHWLHELGHQIALYFVLPVGFTATTTNYLYNHRKWYITSLGWMGLLLVYLANAGCGSSSGLLSWLHHAAGGLFHNVLHAMHHGITHRLTNLAGCGFLIASNYWSRRQPGCAHGPNCNHDHHH